MDSLHSGAAPDLNPLASWLHNLGRSRSKAAAPTPALSVQATPYTSLPALLAEDEVCDVTLAQLVAVGFVDAQLTESGVVRCRTLGGHRFSLSVREGLKVVHFWTVIGGDPARREEFERAAARINSDLALLRAGIDDDGDVLLDTCLSYSGGLVPRQLLHTAALLEVQCARAVCHLPT